MTPKKKKMQRIEEEWNVEYIRLKTPQKGSRLRSRLNLPSQDDFVYSKNYGSGMPAFVLREQNKK